MLARGAAVALAMIVLGVALPTIAQRRSSTRTTQVALDVVGPRTRASVRDALRAHEAELDACRPSEAATFVWLTLTIGADGNVVTATSRADEQFAAEERGEELEEEEVDRTTTECVMRLATTWHFAARAGGDVTTVAWSFRLPPPAGLVCWCHPWVHGPAFGRTCSATRRACERARVDRGLSGTSRECVDLVLPACESTGSVFHPD